MAPPDGSPEYHGFLVIESSEVDGFRLGMITDFGAPPDNWGDGFVVAPDGSRAGLIWESEVDEPSFTVSLPYDERRWGVWSVGSRWRLRTEADARSFLASILPELRAKWESWPGRAVPSPPSARSAPSGGTLATSLRDELEQFLAGYVGELEGAATLTAHEDGWDLEPLDEDASPIEIRCLEPDLSDLFLHFGHLGMFGAWQSQTPEDALEQAKLYVRGVASGGLTETCRGRHSSRWRGSRWRLRLPNGEVRRGAVNWFPWPWHDEGHFPAWHERA